MDLELATNEVEREPLELAPWPVENENSAIDLHSLDIGRSSSNPKEAVLRSVSKAGHS
jgi:hypothetical protein